MAFIAKLEGKGRVLFFRGGDGAVVMAEVVLCGGWISLTWYSIFESI